MGETFHRPSEATPVGERVTVRVPGSTSNLGPGFDCLGLALALHNHVTVSRAAAEPRLPHPMVDGVAARFFAASGREPFPFTWAIGGEVPISRGLGSSVTLRHGILHGLNALAGEPLALEDLFRICAEEEHHPDNAGPAAFGGFFCGQPGGGWLTAPVDPALRFVLLVPELEVLTDAARQVLPLMLPLREVVANTGNAALLAAAMVSGRYEKLRGCFHDHLHQPARAPLIPGLFAVIRAATEAGALGGFLSGSGSTICAVSWHADETAIAAAMLAAWPGPAPARTLVVSADNEGARLVP